MHSKVALISIIKSSYVMNIWDGTCPDYTGQIWTTASSPAWAAVTQDEQLHYDPGMHKIIYKRKEGQFKILCKDMMKFPSTYAKRK